MRLILEELRLLVRYEARHRRLIARVGVVLCVTLAIDLFAASAIFGLEHGAKGSEVHTYWDAFFFTTVQLLTVSSQIKNPVTTGGRVIDIFLEIWAVVVVAGFAGAVTSFFQDAPS